MASIGKKCAVIPVPWYGLFVILRHVARDRVRPRGSSRFTISDGADAGKPVHDKYMWEPGSTAAVVCYIYGWRGDGSNKEGQG